MTDITTPRPPAVMTALGLGAALALTIAGCAGTPSEPEGPVTLSFWHSAEGATAEAVDRIVADFNDAHEGSFRVEAAYQGKYDDTVAKLSAAVQAGDLPDLVQINDVNTAFMMDSGLTVPVTELIAETGGDYDFGALVPAVANYYTVEGVIASMPFQVSQPAVFVRDDVLAATSTTVDDFPSTVDELVRWAEAARAATGKAGLTFHLNPWWFEELSAGAGVVYCTPGNGRGGEPAEAFTIASEVQIAQWSALQNGFASGAILNVGTDFSAGVNALAAGEAGALFSSSGALGTVTNTMTSEWSIVPFPASGPDGGVVPGGNSVFAIDQSLESEAERRAAAEFLAYLGSDDVQREIFRSTGFLPTTQRALNAVLGTADPHQAALLDQLLGTADTTASAGCLSGALQSVRGELTPAIEQIVQGADVGSVLESVQSAAEELVASYNERAGR